MELTAEDIKLQVALLSDGTYELGLPAGEFQEVAPVLLQTAVSIEAAENPGPSRDLERTGDVFEDLEIEMANDAVQQSVALQHTMQDMVSKRLIEALASGETVTGVSGDEIFELAQWFNRQQHLFYRLSGGNEEAPPYMLRVLCLVWAEQLLAEAL